MTLVQLTRSESKVSPKYRESPEFYEKKSWLQRFSPIISHARDQSKGSGIRVQVSPIKVTTIAEHCSSYGISWPMPWRWSASISRPIVPSRRYLCPVIIGNCFNADPIIRAFSSLALIVISESGSISQNSRFNPRFQAHSGRRKFEDASSLRSPFPGMPSRQIGWNY